MVPRMCCILQVYDADSLNYLMTFQSWSQTNNTSLILFLQVLEETGYDISPLIDPNVFLETSIGEQYVRLYIIPGVPTTTEFVPRTKGEIKQLKWFPINQLPSHKNDRSFNKVNGSTNMFYMVMPFVK